MTALLIAAALHITLAAPQRVATIAADALNGDATMLAWSPDGTELYVQATRRDRAGALVPTAQFLIVIGKTAVQAVDQPPPWAGRYWTWKSAHTSPSADDFAIDVESRREPVRATAAPFGGDLARGGVGTGTTTVEDATSAAYQTQLVQIFTLRAKGNVLGDWVNEPVLPGVNFGWAPKPLLLLVVAPRGGGPLSVIDGHGERHALEGAKAAILPAWSEDGTRIAWLARRGKKKYELLVARVSVSE